MPRRIDVGSSNPIVSSALLCMIAVGVDAYAGSVCVPGLEYPPVPTICSIVDTNDSAYPGNVPWAKKSVSDQLQTYWAGWLGGNRYVPAGTVISARKLSTRQSLRVHEEAEGTAPPGGMPPPPFVQPTVGLSPRESFGQFFQLPAYGSSNWFVDYGRVLSPGDSVSAQTAISVSPPLAPSPVETARSLGWFPVSFEDRFLVTCYVLSEEGLFSGATTTAQGLDPSIQYKEAFLKDVYIQGSGKASDGRVIHYDGGGRYSYQSCPLTASGECAVDGATIAIDRLAVPFRSALSIFVEESDNIELTGLRAVDTGGAIKGAHIDRYFGVRRAECTSWGKQWRSVRFDGYL